jgi:hypothetical protein
MKKHSKASSSDIAHSLHGGCKCVRVFCCVGSGTGLGSWLAGGGAGRPEGVALSLLEESSEGRAVENYSGDRAVGL